MRTSNIILLSVLLLACGTAAAIALTIRYKVEHHLYDEQTSPDSEALTVTPLSPFSQIIVEEYDDVTIRKSNVNSIGWINHKRDTSSFYKNASSLYKLSGDSLVLGGANGDRPGQITITAENLGSIHLRYAPNCRIVGFKQDSLAIYAASREDEDGVQFDSTDVQRLRLDLTGKHTFSLSNSTVGGLWLDLKEDAELSLENARVGWIKGRWKGDIGLKADSATLQNGIGKIEPIQ